MSISLLGIIVVQFFWISNAISVKETHFNQAVNRALNDVVDRLQRDQNVMFVSDQVWVDDQNFFEEELIRDSVVWDETDPDENSYYFLTENGTGVEAIAMEGDHGSTVITINTVKDTSIRHKTIIKLDSIKDEYNRERAIVMTELKDSLDIIVDNKIKQIKRRSFSMTEVIDDMVVELKHIDEPLDEKISPEQIEQRLTESLNDQGIELGFEYGLYDPASDSVGNLRSPNFSMDKDHLYKTRMFPESVFNRQDLLLLFFPGKDAHILNSLRFLLSGSVIFTLIIVLTFFLTVRVILRQKKLSEIKSDFINNMTHEFKTPIATISLAVDSINTPAIIKNPEKIQYFTRVIEEENKRMNSSVENVLQMSLIDKRDFDLQPEEFEIQSAIMQVVRKFELQAKKINGEIKLELDVEQTKIVSDPIHFQNILSNLLDNAIKYSGKKPSISIHAHEFGDRIEVLVKDQGIGMTKEEQSKIFDKFYRVPQGDIHNVKGFGLGLSYVKAIVLALHGKIEVKSQPSKGSEFKIILPLTINSKQG